MAKSYALFLGCFIPAVQPFAEASLRKIAPKLRIKLNDIQGATCCPVPEIIRLSDYPAWCSIAARNLSLAEDMNQDAMVVCTGCWETLTEAHEALLHSPELLAEINSKLAVVDKEFTGKSKVIHLLEVLVEKVGVDKIQKSVKRPLTGLRVAVQYGCKYYRTEDEKFVKYFDEVLKAIGATVVEYGAERVCCGYPKSLDSLEEAIEERTKWKFEKIKESQADCLATCCPGCYDMLEKSQFLLRRQKLRYDICQVHLVELIALAFGFSPQEIGLDRHRIKCKALIQKLG